VIFLLTFVPLIFIGCSLVWGVLDFPWVARSPFRIAAVGLFTCASGFYFQTQIHNVESLPVWLTQRVPLFSVNHDVLEFFDKLVDTLVYAVGAGVVTSALFLRAQMRFEQERREQTETSENSSLKIAELERDLRFVDADALLHGVDNAEQRRAAIFRMLDRHRKEVDKANRILKGMGR